MCVYPTKRKLNFQITAQWKASAIKTESVKLSWIIMEDKGDAHCKGEARC